MNQLVVDWSQKPEPWCWIGPQFRAECEAIRDSQVEDLRPQATSLRSRRKALALTQQQLGEIAGYRGASAHVAVSLAERGHATRSAIRRILDALDRLEG